MIARLERHVHGRAAHVGPAGPSGAQRFDLRMRLAAPMVIAFTLGSARAHDDRADGRIGRGVGGRARRELVRSREVRPVAVYGPTSTPFQNAMRPVMFFAASFGAG